MAEEKPTEVKPNNEGNPTIQKMIKRIAELEEELVKERSLSGSKQVELDKLKAELKEAEIWL